jgi:hypothetical protein
VTQTPQARTPGRHLDFSRCSDIFCNAFEDLLSPHSPGRSSHPRKPFFPMGFRQTGTTIGPYASGFRPSGLGGPRNRPAAALVHTELERQSLNTSSEEKRIETFGPLFPDFIRACPSFRRGRHFLFTLQSCFISGPCSERRDMPVEQGQPDVDSRRSPSLHPSHTEFSLAILGRRRCI